MTAIAEADNLPSMFNPNAMKKKSDKRKSGWTFHFPFLFKVSITCFILKTLSSGGCGYIIFPIRVFMCLKFMSDQ